MLKLTAQCMIGVEKLFCYNNKFVPQVLSDLAPGQYVYMCKIV